jgi:hypothetical protein
MALEDLVFTGQKEEDAVSGIQDRVLAACIILLRHNMLSYRWTHREVYLVGGNEHGCRCVSMTLLGY